MVSNMISRRIRRAVLKSAGETQANIQIEVIPGVAVAPRTVGETYHYVTPGGRPVYHPNAYRRAWGKPVYVASTRRVIVGEQWLAAAATECDCIGCRSINIHTGKRAQCVACAPWDNASVLR